MDWYRVLKSTATMKYASLATDDDSDDRKGALFERSCKSKLGRRHFFFILSTLGICLFGATIFIIRKSSNGLHCLTSFNGQKAFTHQPEWESFSNERDHLWEGLLTPNGGFLVQDTEGIKHNVGISMFHQLHCLQAIRTQMQALLPNASNHASAHGGEHDVHHVGHCFDYLRQVGKFHSILSLLVSSHCTSSLSIG